MTAVDVDALAKLREAATPGPWRSEPNFTGGWSLARALIEDADGMPVHYPSGWTAHDAALIVAAVNALPELLAEVRRGRALREAVDGLAAEYHAMSGEAAHMAALPYGTEGLAAVARAYERASREFRAVIAVTDGGGQS